jgi:hypothetical protein
MKRFATFFLLTWLFTFANAQDKAAQINPTFGVALSGSYLLGGSVHFYADIDDTWQGRVTAGFTYFPERDRFSPELSSYAVGGDLLYTFARFDSPQPFSVYAGGGFNVSYNKTTFVYRSFWAFRATPLVGVAWNIGPTLFLEASPEIDFSPYFNVTAVDITPKIRLGIILFEF